MLSSSNQCNQSIIIVLNALLIVLPERAPYLEIEIFVFVFVLLYLNLYLFMLPMFLHCRGTAEAIVL